MNINRSHLLEFEDRLLNEIEKRRKTTAQKFPLLFGAGATFGVTISSYGLWGMMNKIDYIKTHPHYAFIAGLLLLIATGAVYRKLS